MGSRVLFRESTAQHGVESVPLSHLSIEVGHLYPTQFGPGNDHLKRHFERIAPWVANQREDCQSQLPEGTKARVSTCFLIDDYFHRSGEPTEVIDTLRSTASAFGLTIDYIAREAACVEADDVPLARLVLDRLVDDPVPSTTGGRPPTIESGWLCNGQRSPRGIAAAMKAIEAWRPPAENGSSQHSIFMDVQLWSEDDTGRRTFACAFLASVWQLVRLGLLRHFGEAAVRPLQVEGDAEIPDDWDRLPAIMQVNGSAPPFSAYQTLSWLNRDFLKVESAVQLILSQVSVDPAVNDQIARRGRDEGIGLPAEVIDRVGYVFPLQRPLVLAGRGL